MHTYSTDFYQLFEQFEYFSSALEYLICKYDKIVYITKNLRSKEAHHHIIWVQKGSMILNANMFSIAGIIWQPQLNANES